jgi:hypothetical protein
MRVLHFADVHLDRPCVALPGLLGSVGLGFFDDFGDFGGGDGGGE